MTTPTNQFAAMVNEHESRLVSADDSSSSVSLDTPPVSDEAHCLFADAVRVAEKKHTRRAKVFKKHKTRDYTPTISKWNRVDRLIVGFFRQFRDVPFDITRLAFDFYYSAHGEWQHQNLTLHIVDDGPTLSDRKYVKGHYRYGESALEIDSTSPMANLSSDPRFGESQFWRVCQTASSEENCFILHLTNPFESEDKSAMKYALEKGYDTFIKLKRLQQPDLDKDEYYLQSADDGRYLAVTQRSSLYYHIEYSFGFVDDLSDATLFGLTQCHLPRLPRLDIGQRVVYRVLMRYNYETYDRGTFGWVRGRVCDTRCSDFGYEVKIAYGGEVLMDSIYYLRGTVVVEDYSGTTRWTPLTSPNIDFEKHNDNRLYFDPELSMQESACLETTAWNPYSRVEIELCDQVLREGEDRFNRSLKSRRKKKTSKGKERKKTERSNAEALRSLRRIRRKRKKYVKSITHRVFVS